MTDHLMTMDEARLIIQGMQRKIAELERTVSDLTRHNQELRESVTALLAPTHTVKKADALGDRC